MYLIKLVINPDTVVDTYICTSCNVDDEAKKPWLLQHIADPPPPEGPHNVQHTLVLAIDSSASSEPELTTEDRLDRLEKKLDEQAIASQELRDRFETKFEEQAAASQELRDRFENHEKVMQERMEEVSRLLHQLLAHHVQSSSS